MLLKANSKISASETKDCSPEALVLRNKICSNIDSAKRNDAVYTLLRDVTIFSKTGTPNVAANFCTGRSTNARTAWVDENGRPYGEVFPKSLNVETSTSKTKKDTTSTDDSSFLPDCIKRVAESIGKKLIRKNGNAYISADGKDGFVFRTSKIYNQGDREKYWYAYKRVRSIAECKTQNYVFGCNDANTIIILPISEIELQIEGLNYSQDSNGNPSYWHIVFFKDKNGKMSWLISKPKTHEVDITNKLLKNR